MSVSKTIRSLWGDSSLSIVDIAVKCGIDEHQVRKIAAKLELPKRSNKPGDMRKKFLSFLSQGKTKKQIQAKFGGNAEKLLGEKYEGFSLFEQRNAYWEQIYILLPEPPNDLVINEKNWKFAKGTDEAGEEAPYLVVQLPKFTGDIQIAPLYDIHYGNFAHRKEKFLAYIRWIAETPNVYAVLGGDIMENAHDDGRGMTYDQNKNPNSQYNDMLRMLAPIAHKILVCVPGNHEARTEKRTGFDMMAEFAKALKIPYFPGPVFVTILGNGYKWTFYIHHGTGHSQTKGGKMNMAARPKGWTGEINFFLSGHVHDCIVQPDNMLLEDPIRCRLVNRKFWIVVAPSFLSWYKTYAYRWGMKPPAGGGVSIRLRDDGTYSASLTD